MNRENEFESVAATARRILDAYGSHETSDSSRIVYTVADLNIASENGVLEIIFRGTLTFRYAPQGEAAGNVFEEHGVWLEEVERIARSLPEVPSTEDTA